MRYIAIYCLVSLAVTVLTSLRKTDLDSFLNRTFWVWWPLPLMWFLAREVVHFFVITIWKWLWLPLPEKCKEWIWKHYGWRHAASVYADGVFKVFIKLPWSNKYGLKYGEYETEKEARRAFL